MKRSNKLFLIAVFLYVIFSLISLDKVVLGFDIQWSDFFWFVGLNYLLLLVVTSLEDRIDNIKKDKQVKNIEDSIFIKSTKKLLKILFTYLLPFILIGILIFFKPQYILSELLILIIVVYLIYFFASFFNFFRKKSAYFDSLINKLEAKFKKQKKIKRKKNIFQDYLEAILFAFVVAMLIRNYTIQNFKIPSSSMEKTLLIGDYLIGNKLKYFFTDPEQGDIVIFYYPADPEEPEPRENYAKILGPIYLNKTTWLPNWHQKKNVVKRVVGMPGDKVEVKNKITYVNGKVYECGKEQYIHDRIISRSEGNIYWEDKFMGSRDNFGPVIVPEDQYFVMGDNRDVSGDSRYWGFLPREDIAGTPAIVTFSVGETPIDSYRDWVLKYQRHLKGRSSVRWNRTLKLIK